ncbi:SAICAR synthase-like protein [Suhomyces tanzawaensis NRRL Y-17324]|uniref:1-phosphatidylinositol-4-phosphate 5-kinase n=1 Tax=Suhomyces tanzawaensis NRRL Y-17324 TaxID=984487 RepID=A0A1E4SBY8_9ASCO|nr:SAICAR synthase-like protein [Suhomyces tanzawaensis NRRL Y-17324]ODV77019.1 SAICAR synthase-like protein [Suhomyces tanzawaensis NRRL Y-17324]
MIQVETTTHPDILAYKDSKTSGGSTATNLHTLMSSSTTSLIKGPSKSSLPPFQDHHENQSSDPSNHPHNAPSTPTSFKVSRSDASYVTNDTSPSSIEDAVQNEVSSSTAPATEICDDTSYRVSSTISPHHQDDPLHVPTTSATTTPKLHSVPRFLASSDNALVSTNSARRHTAPHPLDSGNYFAQIHDTADLQPARHSFQSSRPNPPMARSTFPAYRGASDSFGMKPDTTSSEILRMRNSILMKRSLKKKRRELLEDERVLVGNKISEGHENFVMAYNMLTGIRVAVSRCSGVMMKLKDEDFSKTKKLSFKMDGSELTPSSKYDFKFKDYCPEVFRELRSCFGLDPADYLVSITGKYILSELGSPGKSGSFFYYSRDFRFIIKTIHHAEHKQLRRILKDYYNHVKENPNTLVSQFYGLHRVKMPTRFGVKKVHFVVMNNLFPPHRDIHVKYDLKGSTWGRITRLSPEESKDLSQVTLKDMNWLEGKNPIKFGPDKRKVFFKQLEADVKLLKKINVMDYSLLLGIHDVKQGNTSDLTQKLSVFDPKSSDKSDLIKTNPRDIDRENDLPTNVFPGRSKYVFYGHDGGIRATNEDNEPLSEIYYLGIIDCLTNYGMKKRLETFVRSLGHARSTISAVPAQEYGNRFLKFIKDGTVNIKRKLA